MNLHLRKATVDDTKGIHALLMSGAAGGLLLSRSLSQIYVHIRDFLVLTNSANEERILGCCALSVIWGDLAEVRSLFVDDSLRGQGYGRLLVERGIEDVAHLGIKRVFTLTYSTGFFASLGFVETGKDTLPQKIWADCINCPKFPDCDEVAMERPITLHP